MSLRGTQCTHPNQKIMTELNIPLAHQFAVLLLTAIPVACATWTVTHEEIFRESREACMRKSEQTRSLFKRKFYYLFTCEYCFSHYVAALAMAIFHAPLLYAGWRGYLMAWLSLVWIANVYMSLSTICALKSSKRT